MSTTVYDVLDQLRERATSESAKGTMFEEMLASYLQVDPTYSEQFSEVWMWRDYPGRDGRPDTGIDLVAVDRITGDRVAIQCKFYAAHHTVSKHDLDRFLSASGTTEFQQRIVVDTGAEWGRHAEATIHDQQIPVRRISLSDLEASTVDWDAFTWEAPTALATTGKKVARPHQREAIAAVREGFQTHDRGQLIMACGTGKTFTSLRLAEEQVGAGGSVLFLVPSISLLSQTVREWATEAEVPLKMLAVCSDPKATARSRSEDASSVDLPLPATTDIGVIQERWAASVADPDAMTVVFSTYQSIEKVAEAQRTGRFAPFDLIVCDEAHRTTGVTVSGKDESAFVKVHDNSFLAGAKRLYMTATPRLYGEESKRQAADGDAVIASMDDEAKFGPEFHRLGFGKAVEQGLLTDYRVLVLSVDESYISENFQHELSEDGEIQLSDAARIVGCWNGLAKRSDRLSGESAAPMQRAVAFAKDIKTSKQIAQAFPQVVDRHVEAADLESEIEELSDDLAVEVRHVDGTFNALERNRQLDWLKGEPEGNTCRVLSNARCLSEGVDVPSVDAVMFLTPRSSEVDVVQSVGRVMRRAEGKGYGYIILPIAVPNGVKPEVALNDSKKYATVWQVLRALRAHDDRFNATVNKIELNKEKRGASAPGTPAMTVTSRAATPVSVARTGRARTGAVPGSRTSSPSTARSGAMPSSPRSWRRSGSGATGSPGPRTWRTSPSSTSSASTVCWPIRTLRRPSSSRASWRGCAATSTRASHGPMRWRCWPSTSSPVRCSRRSSVARTSRRTTRWRRPWSGCSPRWTSSRWIRRTVTWRASTPRCARGWRASTTPRVGSASSWSSTTSSSPRRSSGRSTSWASSTRRWRSWTSSSVRPMRCCANTSVRG